VKKVASDIKLVFCSSEIQLAQDRDKRRTFVKK